MYGRSFINILQTVCVSCVLCFSFTEPSNITKLSVVILSCLYFLCLLVSPRPVNSQHQGTFCSCSRLLVFLVFDFLVSLRPISRQTSLNFLLSLSAVCVISFLCLLVSLRPVSRHITKLSVLILSCLCFLFLVFFGFTETR